MVSRTRSIPMVFAAYDFGNACLARRIELKLIGRDLEILTGLDSSLVYKYERGEEINMKMQNFLKLCNVYDLDPREFFQLEVG